VTAHPSARVRARQWADVPGCARVIIWADNEAETMPGIVADLAPGAVAVWPFAYTDGSGELVCVFGRGHRFWALAHVEHVTPEARAALAVLDRERALAAVDTSDRQLAGLIYSTLSAAAQAPRRPALRLVK
jgi:hypothetical protein